jgi:O-antigen/teichoic acid export membrane protein
MFSYAFSLAIILWAFGMWGGRTFQVSDIKREFSHRNYIVARVVLAVCMLIIAVIFSTANHYDRTKTNVILALVLFKAIESIADALYGVLQAHGRLFLAGRSLLYKAIGGFAVFIAVDILTKNLILCCLGVVMVNLLFVVFYDIRLARVLEDIHITTAYLRQDLRFALAMMKRTAPVFMVVFLSMFTLNIPRYFVDRYHENQIGYFGILAMPITLIGLMMSFALQPNVVHLSQLYAQNKYAEFRAVVRKLTLAMIAVGVLTLLATIAVGVPALGLVFGVKFSAYHSALVVIVAGAIMNALVSIYINILIIIRHFKSQFYILLITNSALVALSVYIVGRYALLGAVTLFTCVNMVQAVMLAWTYHIILHRSARAIS